MKTWKKKELTPKKDDNGLYGYVDEKGNWVIPAQFDDAEDFLDGIARIEKDDKVGFIRKDGSYIVEPIFDDAFNFFEGLADVKLNGKVGYIKTDGTYLIEPKFDMASEFHEGFAIVKIDGRWGYLKKDGTYLIAPIYENADFFENGYAKVVFKGKKGYIDKEGNYYNEDLHKRDFLKIQKSKKVDWEERHFQICLSLLSRPHLHSYHHNTVSTKEVDPLQIIRKADEMMEELKKHYAEKFK